MDDRELLQEYATSASEAAFAELVRRHLNWVHSVARRNVHDPHLASDVTQSVFVLLAKKASSLRRGVVLTGWLFRTTRFIALRARRDESRRKNREQRVSAMMSTNLSDDDQRTWNRVSEDLDQAVASLSERDRSAILLRFYEARSVRDVGGGLGISEDAAKKRIGRAVEKMRKFLLKRGVSVAGVGLIALLSEKTVESAPATLGASVLRTVRLATSGPGPVPELVHQILEARRMLAWKVAGAIAVVSVAAGLTALRITTRSEPAGPAPMTSVSVATTDQVEVETRQPTTQAVSGVAGGLVANHGHPMVIHVIEQGTKRPLPGTALQIYGLQKEGATEQTDKQGSYEIALPDPEPSFLEVTVRKEGFVKMWAFWHTRAGTFHLPKEFTFALEPATSIGGIVQDETGQPMNGVKVHVNVQWSNMEGGTEEIFTDPDDEVLTDADGKWRSDSVPADLSNLSLRFEYPGYFANASQPAVEKLRDMTAAMVMNKGFSIEGVVLADNGQPIERANVMPGKVCCSASTPPTKTDSEGRFRFSGVPPGSLVLTFQAEGHAPELRTVVVGSQTPQLEVHLPKGNVLRGRVVDNIGNPVPDAWVMSDTWRGYRTLGWQGKTDSDGQFVWSNAPPDEVRYAFGKDGFVSINTSSTMPSLKASDEVQVITLVPMLRVHGTVLDADSGQPVSAFKVIPGSTCTETNLSTWTQFGTTTGTNGEYQIVFDFVPTGRFTYSDGQGHETTYEARAHIVRIEAEGYETADSRPFKPDEGDVSFDFRLKRGGWVSLVVRTPDGLPLEGADVTLRDRVSGWPMDKRGTRTGQDGRFSIPVLTQDYAITVSHERGFAYVTRDQLATRDSIIVQPWGRIEGTLRIGNQLGTNQTIVALSVDCGFYQTKALTDDQGSFVVSKVPPGRVQMVRRSVGRLGQQWSYDTDLGSADVQPGQTARVVLGGSGRTLVGKVLSSEGSDSPVDWRYGTVNLTLEPAPDEIKAFLQNPRPNYSCMIDVDGSFRLDDVQAGTYGLHVTVDTPPQDQSHIKGPRLGEAIREVRVPSGGNQEEPLDIGEVQLETGPQPQ
jgi:RNA polymerase sigma factor (sigma-70 family)